MKKLLITLFFASAFLGLELNAAETKKPRFNSKIELQKLENKIQDLEQRISDLESKNVVKKETVEKQPEEQEESTVEEEAPVAIPVVERGPGPIENIVHGTGNIVAGAAEVAATPLIVASDVVRAL